LGFEKLEKIFLYANLVAENIRVPEEFHLVLSLKLGVFEKINFFLLHFEILKILNPKS
jgi:hypothetical protein